ncbi:hypothetical protein EZV62_014478 [Acer yangbiense]|uniref:Aminotransferase class I/classII large domain-containing protein n=1 Tax=Acer yangbiense TaxID=1000413 RepID=A0A5C7HSZ0_9ROSI|nr:hypothetical protein EZV62_014478 [Acer yangbiense]
MTSKSVDDMVLAAATKMSSFGFGLAPCSFSSFFFGVFAWVGAVCPCPLVGAVFAFGRFLVCFAASKKKKYLLSAMLSDKKFTKNYISENQKRLKQRQKKLVSGLKKAEIELWKKIVYDVKLNISPGFSCHCTEPGWFRVCFANMSEETLKLSMQLLKAFVDTTINVHNQSNHQSVKNSRRKSFTKWVFRLSLDDCEPCGER